MSRKSRLLVVLALLLVLSPPEATAAALDEDPYQIDPGFAGGAYLADNFGLFSRYQVGRRFARFGNGDLLVVGLAEASTMPSPRRMNNIGMARYTASGQLVPWSDPPAQLSYGGRLIYPNWETTDFREVKDVVVSDDYIFVLHDRQISATRIDSYVAVFDHAGRPVDWFAAFRSSSRDEFGTGLVYYEVRGPTGTTSRRLFAAASSRPGGVAGAPFKLVVSEIRVGDNGVLSGLSNTIVAHWRCDPSFASCQGVRLARSPTQNPHLPPRLYVAGLHRDSSNFTHAFVMRLKPDGSTDHTFGHEGFRRLSAFELVQPWIVNEHATGLVIRSNGSGGDDIFVSGRIDMRCSHGASVFRLNHDGSFDKDFGYLGAMVYGGSDVQPAFCSSVFPPPAHNPMGIAVDGRRLAIAGYANRLMNCASCGYQNDGYLAIVDSESGDLLEHRELRNPESGERATHSVLRDIMPAGDGRFTLVGELVSLAGAAWTSYQFATIQVRPDRLFGSGFQAAP